MERIRGSDSLALGENYTNTIIKRTAALLLLAIGLSFLLAKEPMPYIYGFIFGGSISILGFKLIEQNAKKAVKMGESGARSYVAINYFVRYLIYGLTLAIAAKADYIDFLSAVASLFIIKIVIVSDAFYDTLKGKKK